MAESFSALISPRNKSPLPADSRVLVNSVPVETNAGVFLAGFSDDGLVELDFPRGVRSSSVTCNLPPHIREWKAMAASALDAIFSGREPRESPPFDWGERSRFHQKVWRALLDIPFGHTRTYSEVAELVGVQGGARAVGNACGANPIPVLVPCHRVLAAGGKLGGFSSGLEWKRKLLAAEKVQLL
jgi:O-6-methylguanine DNA methyltransferase